MDEDDSSPEFSDGIEFPRVLPRTPAGHGSVNLGLHLVRKARGSAFSTMRDDSIGERATGVEGFDRGEQYRFDAGLTLLSRTNGYYQSCRRRCRRDLDCALGCPRTARHGHVRRECRATDVPAHTGFRAPGWPFGWWVTGPC